MFLSFTISSRRLPRPRLFSFFLALLLSGIGRVQAHQSPTSVVLLDVSPIKVTMELQLPLSELALAFGHQEVTGNAAILLQKAAPQLKEYLLAHIHAFVTRDNPWMVTITGMKAAQAVQLQSGPAFQEITVLAELLPPANNTTRHFMLDYDVIMHQVVNHVAFVSVRNDWETGKNSDSAIDAGIIRVDTRTMLINPLEIQLQKGSWFAGFTGMVALGSAHIREGTDHLLFIVVLLLPAMLPAKGRRWGRFGGLGYSITHVLKIVTAFTIGHSATLLLGAVGWLRLPAQPVEVLIAVSVLVSAVHAVTPVFAGKETWVAAGFGLVHGLAFAGVLSGLHLGAGAMALSILGFNLGIELMQLLVILLLMPWLLLLSRTVFYTCIRITAAVVAAMTAMVWIAERVSGHSGTLAAWVQKAAEQAHWCILLLAVTAIIAYVWQWRTVKTLI